MALLEKDNDIHATYYILLTNALYNSAAPDSVEKIRAIKKAGHEIGLHIDTRYYLGQLQFSLLEHIAQCDIITWSRHLVRITPDLAIPNDATKIPYKYLSNSSMHWREGCFCQHINKHDKLQILIHPEWHACSPKATLNHWEILEQLEWEANRRNGIAFRQFAQMVKHDHEALNIHTQPEGYTRVRIGNETITL